MVRITPTTVHIRLDSTILISICTQSVRFHTPPFPPVIANPPVDNTGVENHPPSPGVDETERGNPPPSLDLAIRTPRLGRNATPTGEDQDDDPSSGSEGDSDSSSGSYGDNHPSSGSDSDNPPGDSDNDDIPPPGDLNEDELPVTRRKMKMTLEFIKML